MDLNPISTCKKKKREPPPPPSTSQEIDFSLWPHSLKLSLKERFFFLSRDINNVKEEGGGGGGKYSIQLRAKLFSFLFFSFFSLIKAKKREKSAAQFLSTQPLIFLPFLSNCVGLVFFSGGRGRGGSQINFFSCGHSMLRSPPSPPPPPQAVAMAISIDHLPLSTTNESCVELRLRASRPMLSSLPPPTSPFWLTCLGRVQRIREY